MSGLEKSPEALSPEERLRRLMTNAVEPVQPAPGAQARLQAKIHARQRAPQAPGELARHLRWAGAALGGAAVLAAVVFGIASAGHGTAKSSSTAASGSNPAAPSAGPSQASSSAAVSYGKQASPQARSGAGAAAPEADASSAAGGATALGPLSAVPLSPDLDGDGAADRLRLSGQRLVVSFRSGSQAVTLPQVGPGARVLGITRLQNSSGAATRVAFIRLRSDPVHAYDTVVAVVGGKLSVLRLAGKPVVLAVAKSQGYACAGSSAGPLVGPLVVTTTQPTSYVVSGANLIPGGSGAAGASCQFG